MSISLQFESGILDVCLKILDENPKFMADADQDTSARRNSVYVTRVLSAMVGLCLLSAQTEMYSTVQHFKAIPKLFTQQIKSIKKHYFIHLDLLLKRL